jgi:hypothetical protein
MFIVTEADAAAIRAAFGRGGELSAQLSCHLMGRWRYRPVWFLMVAHAAPQSG